MKRVEITIEGGVQGVFFRQGVKEVASGLGLRGVVRNEPDGSVKIVAEGEEDNLQTLINWCRKGTTWAKVKNVQVVWKKTLDEFKNFEIA